MIGVMALQASVLQKQGRTDDALGVLEEAVDLARPGGFIRPFVELGATMEGLLKRLAQENVALDYIGKLLAAFREDQHGVKHRVFGTGTVGRSSLGNQPLVDPLTNRELEVLDLLAQRLYNKEIAAKLFISLGTVKTHLKNIYRKLNVTGRLQAVEKTYSLNIRIRR
jgi:LuxR family maltose regulon positive regulatory protein